MIKILDKSGAVLRYFDADTLSGANLSGAYLRYADLRGAYLRGAYLRGAYLNRWQGRNGNVGKRNN